MTRAKVTRHRYHFKEEGDGITQSPDFCFTGHYDVVLPERAGVEDPEDYVRMYYTEYMEAAPAAGPETTEKGQLDAFVRMRKHNN